MKCAQPGYTAGFAEAATCHRGRANCGSSRLRSSAALCELAGGPGWSTRGEEGPVGSRAFNGIVGLDIWRSPGPVVFSVRLKRASCCARVAFHHSSNSLRYGAHMQNLVVGLQCHQSDTTSPSLWKKTASKLQVAYINKRLQRLSAPSMCQPWEEGAFVESLDVAWSLTPFRSEALAGISHCAGQSQCKNDDRGPVS